ncbi:MAG: HAMP domain-containing protein [Desulfobacterales bacterium]|nr:MAG: HAMP domain-containing protein [Desulfobacterales bacterium]
MNLIPKTIRAQIMMAFLFCFVFMAVIIAVNYNNFRQLSRSMQFFELAEELNSTILEMRRYEKNYFLYRQEFNYEENVTYTNRLALILERERESLIGAIGQDNYGQFIKYVRDYTALMSKLRQTSCDPGGCADLQTLIRGAGQNLLLLADQLVATERRTIDLLIQQMIPLPLISLLILVVLLGFVVFYIGEKVIRPLARITRESEAVAQGAFQRITPYGDTKNEIHHLVAAINRMMAELEKRQEQLIQSRKIASIGTLTAGISHEINNPVNNISLIMESLIEDADTMDDGERRRLYQEAMDQADRTSEIVKNLLEFSRASPPRVEDVNVEQVVDKTARLLNNELNLHHIKFVKEFKAGFANVRLDKGGLQQVLLNLFMNSIQAMEGGGELKVAIGPADLPGELRIDVVDNGPGIPPEYIGQIFDPFFTTKKEGIGTGLGLSVSYNIIKKNGGRMQVQSPPGQGACFSIFLPVSENAYPRE